VPGNGSKLKQLTDRPVLAAVGVGNAPGTFCLPRSRAGVTSCTASARHARAQSSAISARQEACSASMNSAPSPDAAPQPRHQKRAEGRNQCSVWGGVRGRRCRPADEPEPGQSTAASYEHALEGIGQQLTGHRSRGHSRENTTWGLRGLKRSMAKSAAALIEGGYGRGSSALCLLHSAGERWTSSRTCEVQLQSATAARELPPQLWKA